MGILFIHTEDNKYHIYRVRSRLVWFLYIVIAFVLLFVFLLSRRSESAAIAIFVLFLVILLAGAIETVPIGYKRWLTRFRGKKEIENGVWFRGNYEIKIEK